MIKKIVDAVKSLYSDEEASYRNEFESGLSTSNTARNFNGDYVNPSIQGLWVEFRKEKEQEDMEGSVW